MPECTNLGEHGMKLTQKRREMSTFRSTEKNKIYVKRLCLRCVAFGEGATSAGRWLKTTEVREVAAAITIMVLLKIRKKHNLSNKKLRPGVTYLIRVLPIESS